MCVFVCVLVCIMCVYDVCIYMCVYMCVYMYDVYVYNCVYCVPTCTCMPVTVYLIINSLSKALFNYHMIIMTHAMRICTI